MNYKKGDVVYYYDFEDFVKVRIITKSKKLKRFPGVDFFKVEVIDNTHWNKDRMPIGYIFNPNSSTCFYNIKERKEHKKKVVEFWKRTALAEIKAISTGKMKPKSFFEM